MSADDPTQDSQPQLAPEASLSGPPTVHIGTWTPTDEMRALGAQPTKVLSLGLSLTIHLPLSDDGAREMGAKLLEGSVQIATEIPSWMSDGR